MPTVEDYQQAGDTLLKQGAALMAYDAVAEGLRAFPGDTRLRQLLALALARTGASRQANQLLRAQIDEGHADEEAVGMLARTCKDLWASTRDADERRGHLAEAFRWYRETYQRWDSYWGGINAATMALLLGNLDESRALAREVRDLCLRLNEGAAGRTDVYWLLATLGEAELLLGEVPAAESWYRQATGLGGRRVGDLVSTRRNARLIVRHNGIDGAPIEACFHVPRVAVFSGHLIDRPGRVPPRFPPEVEHTVRRDLLARLRTLDIGVGYSSAACGGDILFLEVLREIGAELQVVLPYNRAQFQEDSVDYVPGADWAARYAEVLRRARQVVTASEQRMLGGAMSYEYGFLLLDGQAAVRAEELDSELVCVALWDGKPGDGPGGTAASVEHWRRAGRSVEIIELGSASNVGLPPRVTTADRPDEGEAPSEASGTAFEAQLVGLLFADVAGFSKLTESQIPVFVEDYLGLVASVLEETPEPPLLTNTWGDGLYFVFRTVRETGQFALRLSAALRAVDWSSHGLPPTLSIRIAVHAGPAYACVDPVTARHNFLGSHVALAARIEPVTPPGEVYGSGAFAALAKAAQIKDFLCAYVGQTPLAKGYGTLPVYVLRPGT